MKEVSWLKRYEHTPTEDQITYLSRAKEVINELPNRIKSGDINDATREVIDGHFFNSMQVCINDYLRTRPIDLAALNKKPYVTLFEAAFLIGSRINADDQECLLTYSSSLFSDSFLSREVDPRHHLTRTKFSAFQPPPRAVIATGEYCKPDQEPERLGGIVIHEIPDLSWYLTLKEVAEFAILKGYPEHLFSDLLREQPTEKAPLNTENCNTKLLEIIGLLAETLANTNPGDLRNEEGGVILGNGEKGIKKDKTNLLYEISITLEGLEQNEGVKAYGLGPNTIGPLIKEGIKAIKRRH